MHSATTPFVPLRRTEPARDAAIVPSGSAATGLARAALGGWCGACRLLGLSLLVFLGFAAVPAAQAQSREEIQSALIFNFARFVTWPETAFASPTAPVRLVFVEADGLATTFTDVVRGKNVNGREFEIVKGGAADLAGAHIVFVGGAGQYAAVSAAVTGKPILSVGEEGFLGAGGMIAMLRDGAKVVFEIDVSVLNATGLTVDPRLLRIAKTVKGQ